VRPVRVTFCWRCKERSLEVVLESGYHDDYCMMPTCCFPAGPDYLTCKKSPTESFKLEQEALSTYRSAGGDKT
jgi:hypothetical protein